MTPAQGSHAYWEAFHIFMSTIIEKSLKKETKKINCQKDSKMRSKFSPLKHSIKNYSRAGRRHRDQGGWRLAALLKSAWAQEPVLVASLAIGAPPKFCPAPTPTPGRPPWATRSHPTTTQCPTGMTGTCPRCSAPPGPPRSKLGVAETPEHLH